MAVIKVSGLSKRYGEKLVLDDVTFEVKEGLFFGCFGPKETPNAPPLSNRLAELGLDSVALERIYRTFNANADDFRKESERHGAQNDKD